MLFTSFCPRLYLELLKEQATHKVIRDTIAPCLIRWGEIGCLVDHKTHLYHHSFQRRVSGILAEKTESDKLRRSFQCPELTNSYLWNDRSLQPGFDLEIDELTTEFYWILTGDGHISWNDTHNMQIPGGVVSVAMGLWWSFLSYLYSWRFVSLWRLPRWEAPAHICIIRILNLKIGLDDRNLAGRRTDSATSWL